MTEQTVPPTLAKHDGRKVYLAVDPLADDGIYVFDTPEARDSFAAEHQATPEAFKTDEPILTDPMLEDTPHPKVRHGRCPVCGHYGDDCAGEAASR